MITLFMCIILSYNDINIRIFIVVVYGNPINYVVISKFNTTMLHSIKLLNRCLYCVPSFAKFISSWCGIWALLISFVKKLIVNIPSHYAIMVWNDHDIFTSSNLQKKLTPMEHPKKVLWSNTNGTEGVLL